MTNMLGAKPRPPITVVGAGVSGLTTALVLLQRGHAVRIVAGALPPDVTSAVPAALWLPYKAEPRDRVVDWARTTYRKLQTLAGDPATGVVARTGRELHRQPIAGPWWRDAVPASALRPVPGEELPAGYAAGFELDSFVMETPIYLPWLVEQARAAGAEFEQKQLGRLADVVAMAEGACVVNCAGLGAGELVPDRDMFPSRGQLVYLEPSTAIDRFLVDESPEAVTYVIPRRDVVVLGSTVDDGVASTAVDDAAGAAIVARAQRLVPELTGLRVVRQLAGVRPCRSRVRLECERVGATAVVHNYGHGGSGYVLSWGCAEHAAGLVEEAAGG